MEPQFKNHVLPLHFGLTAYGSMEYIAQQIKKEPNLFHGDVSHPTITTTEKKYNKPTEPPKLTKAPGKSFLENKSHHCYVCGKTLSSTSSYYVHMKQHSGHKPYHCPMCEVSFCRKPYLEVHMRTHTGERPFQCLFCFKRFTQKSSLNIHKRSHTGEKPYSCEICDKKFAVKSYVDAHRWTHSFEKPLLCEKCHIPFNSRTQYLLHMRTHSSVFAYECPCGRTFTKDSYLIRHQVKVHHHLNRSSVGHSPNSVYSQNSSLNTEDSDSKDFDFSRSPTTKNIKTDADESDLKANQLTSTIQEGMQSYVQSPTTKNLKEENLGAMPLTSIASAIQEGMQSYGQEINSHLGRL